MRGHALAATGVVVCLSALTARTFAGDYDLEGDINVPPHSRVILGITFTGGVDGNGDSIILQAGDQEFINGTDSAMTGAVIPSNVADLLLQTTPKQPSRKPINRLPASPRKIDAGLKLSRKNPNSAPASGAVASAR